MSRKRPLEDPAAYMTLSRKGIRHHCPHCDQSLSTKTFKSHKRLYFDEVSYGAFNLYNLPPLSIGTVITVYNTFFRKEMCGAILVKVMSPNIVAVLKEMMFLPVLTCNLILSVLPYHLSSQYLMKLKGVYHLKIKALTIYNMCYIRVQQ